MRIFNLTYLFLLLCSVSTVAGVNTTYNDVSIFNKSIQETKEKSLVQFKNQFQVEENKTGLAVANFDNVDSNRELTYIVSDERFEFEDNKLKLKKSASLDFEKDQSKFISLCAIDHLGNYDLQFIELNIKDIYENTLFNISSVNSIKENKNRSFVTKFNIIDEESFCSSELVLNDNRFEIINDSLFFKQGVSIGNEKEEVISLQLQYFDQQNIKRLENIDITVEKNKNELSHTVEKCDQKMMNSFPKNKSTEIAKKTTINQIKDNQENNTQKIRALSNNKFQSDLKFQKSYENLHLINLQLFTSNCATMLIDKVQRLNFSVKQLNNRINNFGKLNHNVFNINIDLFCVNSNQVCNNVLVNLNSKQYQELETSQIKFNKNIDQQYFKFLNISNNENFISKIMDEIANFNLSKYSEKNQNKLFSNLENINFKNPEESKNIFIKESNLNLPFFDLSKISLTKKYLFSKTTNCYLNRFEFKNHNSRSGNIFVSDNFYFDYIKDYSEFNINKLLISSSNYSSSIFVSSSKILEPNQCERISNLEFYFTSPILLLQELNHYIIDLNCLNQFYYREQLPIKFKDYNFIREKFLYQKKILSSINAPPNINENLMSLELNWVRPIYSKSDFIDVDIGSHYLSLNSS
jgi:hypothetical protein